MRDNKFLKSSVIVMLLLIIGKILAFLRDALIAAKFGASYASDIYMFAFGTVMLLTSVGYGLTTTFIPIHIENIEKKSKEDRNRYVNNVLNIYVLFTIIVMILGIFFAKYIIIFFANGFTKNAVIFKESVEIIQIMFLSLIFVSLQSIVTGVLQAHKYFYEPSAMSVASNFIYVAYLVFLPGKFGIVGFGAATVIGFLAQYLINVPRFRALGYRYEFVIDFSDKDVKKLIYLMLPVILSTSLIQINLFINRSFAANLFEGAVSVLDYSNKITTLIYEVFAVGITTVVYPTLATFAAQNNSKEYKNALLKSVNIIFLILLPAAVGMVVLRTPIVSVIFKRGAFKDSAVLLTANALLYFSPAMIFYGVRDILSRAFYSLKDTKTPMLNSFVGIAVNLILSFILSKIMNVAGLTLASSLSTIFTTLVLLYILNRKLNKIGINKIINAFIKTGVASVLMGVVIYFINYFILNKIGSNLRGNLASIIICMIAGIIAYVISLYLLKVEEFVYVMKIVKKR